MAKHFDNGDAAEAHARTRPAPTQRTVGRSSDAPPTITLVPPREAEKPAEAPKKKARRRRVQK